METDELKKQIERLKESGASPSEESSNTEPEPEPESEGEQWIELGGIAGSVLIDDPHPQIQPEDDYPAEDPKLFRPRKYRRTDDYDASYIAIPHPHWPSPGGKMTPEVSEAYHTELTLCAVANNRLRQYCYWLTHEKLHLAALPAAKETDELRERADRSLLQDAEQRAAEHLAWLTGLWSARGIPIPTGEDLEELAASRAQAVNRWQ
jgi:hypothetical protein